MFRGSGTLSDSMIRMLIKERKIRNAQDDNVSPASLDLSLSSEIYRVRSSALPIAGQSIKDLLKILGAIRIAPGTIMEPGTMYMAKANESFSLPDGLYGYCNPKSSVGRDGLRVRIISDGIPEFDSIPGGMDKITKKPRMVWFLIDPSVMPVRMFPGETLAQIRIFTWDTRLSQEKMERLYRMKPLFFGQNGKPIPWDHITCFDDGSLAMALDLRPGVIVGWHCKENRQVIDYSAVQSKEDYFDPIIPDRYGGIQLKKGSFSILGTAPGLLVPPDFSCEVKAVSKRLANADIHAAGFIDPGWGYGEDGSGNGSRITLEVWAHDDWYIQPGQLIGELRFEEMIEPPSLHYDEKTTSHYRGQTGARPSKRFV